jgi:hypothetical protein
MSTKWPQPPYKHSLPLRKLDPSHSRYEVPDDCTIALQQAYEPEGTQILIGDGDRRLRSDPARRPELLSFDVFEKHRADFQCLECSIVEARKDAGVVAGQMCFILPFHAFPMRSRSGDTEDLQASRSPRLRYPLCA